MVKFQGNVTTDTVTHVDGGNVYDFSFDVFEKPAGESDADYFARFTITPVSGSDVIAVTNVERNTPSTGRTRITLAPPVTVDFTLTYPPTNFGASVGAAVREYTRRPLGLNPAPTNPTPAEKLELRPSTAVFAFDDTLESYVSDYWILELITGDTWRPFQDYVVGDEVQYRDSGGIPRHVFCNFEHTSSEETNPILPSSVSHIANGNGASIPWEPVGAAIDLSTGTFEAPVQILVSDGGAAAIALNGGNQANEDRWFINVGQGTSAIRLPDSQIPSVGDLISFGIGANGTTEEYRVAEVVAVGATSLTSLRFDGSYPAEVEALVDDNTANPVNLFNAGLRTDFGQVDRLVYATEDFSINTEAQDIGHGHITASGIVTANLWQSHRQNLYVAGSVVSDFSLVFDTAGTTVLGFSGRDYIRRAVDNPSSGDVTRPSEETYVWNEGTQSYEGTYWLAVLFAGARWRPHQLYFERDVIEYEGIDNVPRQAFCQVAHTSTADTNPAIVGATIFDVQGHDADHPWEPVGASLNVSTQTGVASADPFQNASTDVLVRGSGLGTDERVGQWFVDLTSAEDPGVGVNIGTLTVPIGTGIAFGTNANTAYELQFSELADPDGDDNEGTRWWFAFADGVAQFVPPEVANGALTARVFLTTARVDYGQITRLVFDEEQFTIETSDPHIGHASIGIKSTGAVSLVADNTFTGENTFENDVNIESPDGVSPGQLSIKRVDTTPTAGDDLGVIVFEGNADNNGTLNANRNYAVIGADIVNPDIATGVSDLAGEFFINVANNGGAGISGNNPNLTVRGGSTSTSRPIVRIEEGTDFFTHLDSTATFNGTISGPGITNSFTALTDSRNLRRAVAGGGMTIVPDTTLRTDTFIANAIVSSGQISLPNQSGVVTATGAVSTINTFITQAAGNTYTVSSDGVSLPVPTPVSTSVDFNTTVLTGDDPLVPAFSGGGSGWEDIANLNSFDNNQPISALIRSSQPGDFILIYLSTSSWGLYEVSAISTQSSGQTQIDVEPRNSAGTPTTGTGTAVGSLRTSYTAGTGSATFSSEFAVNASDTLRYRDANDHMTLEAVFDLVSSGITTNNNNTTFSGAINGASANAMAYLAIQFAAGNPQELVELNYNSTSDTLGGETFRSISAVGQGGPFDGLSPAALTALFAANVYLAYQSTSTVILPDGTETVDQRIFVDTIDRATGTTVTRRDNLIGTEVPQV